MASLEEQLGQYSISDDFLSHFVEESFAYGGGAEFREKLRGLKLSEVKSYLTDPSYDISKWRKFKHGSGLGVGIGLIGGLFGGLALAVENLIRYGEVQIEGSDTLYATAGLALTLGVFTGLVTMFGGTRFSREIGSAFITHLETQKRIQVTVDRYATESFSERVPELAQFFDDDGKLKIKAA